MALLLDLDNTILPSRACYEATIVALAKDWADKGYGSQNDFFQLYESGRKITKEQLREHSSNRLRLLYFQKIWESWKGSFHQKGWDFVFWLEGRYNHHFSYFLTEERANRSEWEELFALLQETYQKFGLCFITNENLRTQMLKLRSFLPLDLRYEFVCSEEVGKEKPALEYFLYVLSKTKSSPEDCFVIGDNWVDDIEGASRAGISGLHLTEQFGALEEVNALDAIQGVPVYRSNNVLQAIRFAWDRLTHS